MKYVLSILLVIVGIVLIALGFVSQEALKDIGFDEDSLSILMSYGRELGVTSKFSLGERVLLWSAENVTLCFILGAALILIGIWAFNRARINSYQYSYKGYDVGAWKCPKCGAINKKSKLTCPDCGTMQS